MRCLNECMYIGGASTGGFHLFCKANDMPLRMYMQCSYIHCPPQPPHLGAKWGGVRGGLRCICVYLCMYIGVRRGFLSCSLMVDGC